jgi:hypothetical protein
MIDERAKKIIDDWCKETKMKVEFTSNGLRVVRKFERKGSYVKELNELDYDLPIVNEAIVKYLTENIPVEKTVNECSDLIKFQKIVKVSGAYKYASHNGKKLDGKCFRVFASRSYTDSYIGKCKAEGATVEKFANTPEHCFIDNGKIKNKKVSGNLDKLWYINMATKRLNEKFGLNLVENRQLELPIMTEKKVEVKKKIGHNLDPMDIF